MPTKKSSPPLIPAKQTKIAGVQNHAVPKRKTTKTTPPPSKDKKITGPKPPENQDATCLKKIEPKIITQNKKR